MTKRVLRGFRPEKHRELRLRAGLSIAELARLSGVQAKSIREWESGQKTPVLVSARKAARVLKVGIPAITDVPPSQRMLSDLLNRRGLTPPEFAKAVGISTTYYYEIERGEKAPNEIIVQHMARNLKVSASIVAAAWRRAKNRPPGSPA